MDKKEFIQYLRNNRIIKGNRPSFVYLRKNFGNIYNGKRSNFILSIKDNILHFQKVTFFKGLKPAEDFKLNVSDFINYRIIEYNILFKSLCLYDSNRNFIEIFYDTNRKDSPITEMNIEDIAKRLKEAGLNEITFNEVA